MVGVVSLGCYTERHNFAYLSALVCFVLTLCILFYMSLCIALSYGLQFMSKTIPKILIFDAMWNKTLAAVRSLGKRGFYLAVGEKTRFATALFSRYCSKRIVYPSPASMPDEFLQWLLREVKSNKYD